MPTKLLIRLIRRADTVAKVGHGEHCWMTKTTATTLTIMKDVCKVVVHSVGCKSVC